MPYSDEVLADTPLAFWKIDETAGTSLADSSGNARAATWSGTPTFGAAPLTSDATAAVTFSGDDYASTPGGAWAFTASWTWEAVVNWTAAPNGWVDVFTNGPDNEVFVNSDGSVEVYTKLAGASVTTKAPVGSIPANTTKHLAVTYDGAQVLVYINGTQAASVAATGALTSNTNPWYIGTWPPPNSGGLFQGRLSHVAMYGTALAPARISAHSAAVNAEPPNTGTSTEYENDAYNLTGTASVFYDVPVAPAPSGVVRAKIRRVHQSLPAPTLVNGRPV